MNINKDKLVSEILGYVRNVLVVFMVALLFKFNISLASLFIDLNNTKLIWFVDVAFYTCLAQIIITLIINHFRESIFYIETYLVVISESQEVNSVQLKKGEKKTIKLKLLIRGDSKRMPEAIKVPGTADIDMQIKKVPYISIDEDNNVYINLSLLTNNKEKINISKMIDIDVIRNEDSEDGTEEIKIEVENKKSEWSYFKIKEFKFILKGE